ncbi:MAG: sugar ABC transporter ATP-binding protein [Anaerolineaceae bacterium]|nr:MAG: sugar ABC transporter ATP-binding protein [Anaerolineaceae bacterium]
MERVDECYFEARGICKSFPGVVALDNVDLQIEKGEIHALIGANGAGKSTIIKIISGVQSADSGTMLLEGKEVYFRNPNQAFEAGIGTVFQDFELAHNLTVAENIFLGKLNSNHINWKEVKSRAVDIMDKLQIKIDPEEIVGNLSVGEQQMIEIARVMYHDVKILIMDEPTSSLSNEDVKRLFELMRRLVNQGVSIIYVSHRMEEIYEISDRITVLRDGKLNSVFKTKETSAPEVIKAMVGNVSYEVEHKNKNISDDVILKVEDLKSNLVKKPVSFELKHQEILGIAGLIGSGRTEILTSLYGLADNLEGNIEFDGSTYKPRTPKEALDSGMAMIPEDRHNSGTFPNLSVKNNISIACIDEIKKHGFISGKKEKAVAVKAIKKFGVKTPNPDTLISNLSGGNQQKVIFAKWLTTEKKILLLDEPTRGIDVRAKAEIYDITSELAKEGLSVILVSSELKELMDICDRILVLKNGEFISEVNREDFDYNTITEMMMGA